MKTMIISLVVCLLTCIGCANTVNPALVARVNAAEAEQKRLHEEIVILHNDADLCTTAAIKARAVADYVKETAAQTYEAARQAYVDHQVTERVEKKTGDTIEAVEKKAGEEFDAARKAVDNWMKDHNF